MRERSSLVLESFLVGGMGRDLRKDLEATFERCHLSGTFNSPGTVVRTIVSFGAYTSAGL